MNAEEFDRQNKAIAALMWEDVKRQRDAWGKQPIDSNTGEPVPKVDAAQRRAIFEMARDGYDEVGLRLIATEATKLELPEGILPRKLWLEMCDHERQREKVS